jgi:hypothetical protein
MNKRLIFLNILFVIGFLISAWGTTGSVAMPAGNLGSSVHMASLALQATPEPPIPFPTIVINPTPGSGGSFPQMNTSTLLLYVLVGAIILIALIAVLKR